MMHATADVQRLRNNEERERLAALERGLVDDHRPYDTDAASLRRQITTQGAHYEVAQRVQITQDCLKPTDCEHCKRMQNDMRFLLVHILNVLEQIKAPVRVIAQTLNEERAANLDREESEADTPWSWFCCFPVVRFTQ